MWKDSQMGTLHQISFKIRRYHRKFYIWAPSIRVGRWAYLRFYFKNWQNSHYKGQKDTKSGKMLQLLQQSHFWAPIISISLRNFHLFFLLSLREQVNRFNLYRKLTKSMVTFHRGLFIRAIQLINFLTSTVLETPLGLPIVYLHEIIKNGRITGKMSLATKGYRITWSLSQAIRKHISGQYSCVSQW